MPAAEPIDIPSPAELNAMSADEFATAVAPLFEGGPGFLRRLAEARPFATDAELLAAAHETADSISEAEQIELIQAHPRIGADPSELSAMSSDEQGSAEATPAHVAEELSNLNDLYERRFGFRFVVFVAGRPKEAIIPLIEHALRNDREAELRRGVHDVVYIAGDRLRMLRGAVDEDQEPEAPV